MNYNGKVFRTYSTGFILRLYRIESKCARRDPSRSLVSISFFKKYLPNKILNSLRYTICKGYKRKYDFFLQTQLIPFIKQKFDGLVFVPKVLQQHYDWRRIAPIKKRIRKRLSIRSK